MITDKKVEVIINSNNMKHFREIGYDNISISEVILVSVNELSKGSHSRIKCKCDNCGVEKIIEYRTFRKYNNNNDEYYCRKCAQFKMEETNLRLYGKKYPSQREEVQDKMKNTCLERFGVENASQLKEFQDKKIETNRKNWGTDWGLSSDIIKDKSKKTCLEKYGVDKPSKSKEIRNKIKCKMKNFDLQKSIRSNTIKTCLEKYGVEHYFQTEDYKEKFKNTCIKRYGVEHVLQNEQIYKNMIRTSFIIKQYNNTPLYYQGSYEKDFLDNYFSKLFIMNGKTISYDMDNKKHKYYSDFFLPDFNLIVEIKSKIWYNKHILKNIEKEKKCKLLGYNFIFIIDKNYEEFKKITSGN